MVKIHSGLRAFGQGPRIWRFRKHGERFPGPLHSNSVNITDQQKDLLRLLVSKHESNRGAPFIFRKSFKGNRLSYSHRDSVRVGYDGADLRRLRQERLITLVPLAEHRSRGRPTDFGIAMVRCGFCPTRVMREFEEGCPLLAESVVDQLNRSGEEPERDLNRQLDLAGALVRQRRAALDQIKGKQKREAAEIDLRGAIARLRRQILKSATTLVQNGVREFGDALVASQRTLGNRSTLLREYTARFVAKIRDKLNESLVFQVEPLSAWRKDAMTQKAIQACEEVIAKRKKIEGASSSTAEAESKHGPRRQQESKTWPPVVQEWEGLKSTTGQSSGDGERIPETDLRNILAILNAIKPDDVTEEQIEHAAMELVNHYSRFRIVPVASADIVHAADKSKEVSTIRDAGFWTEREAEFRRYDAAPHAALGATWNSWGDYWTFRSGDDSSPSVESVNLFTSLARESAKGIGSRRGAESWMDWLDLLRDAKDEDTGRLLYSQNFPSSRVMNERELERQVKAGEVIASGGLMEFVEGEDGGIERRTYWDLSSAIIKNIFKNSASHCLRLRSLAPHTKPSAADTGSDPLRRTLDEAIGTRHVQHEQADSKDYRTALGRNIDTLRRECGWSFDELAKETGLEKALILGHVNDGKGARPRTVRFYADAFTSRLKRTVTVAELEGRPGQLTPK